VSRSRRKDRAGCPQPAARRDVDIAPYPKHLRKLQKLSRIAVQKFPRKVILRATGSGWHATAGRTPKATPQKLNHLPKEISRCVPVGQASCLSQAGWKPAPLGSGGSMHRSE